MTSFWIKFKPSKYRHSFWLGPKSLWAPWEHYKSKFKTFFHPRCLLQVLRLHQSHVDDKKCRLLVKHLLDHPSLRQLDFSHNLISDKGARAVAKLLSRSSLQELDMCDNHIRDHGAKAIAHALSNNSTLLSLNLRLNRVRDEGGQALGEALLRNCTLRHLHLGGNEVGRRTAAALSEALRQNNVLRSINLSCNSLGEVSEAEPEYICFNISQQTRCRSDSFFFSHEFPFLGISDLCHTQRIIWTWSKLSQNKTRQAKKRLGRTNEMKQC